MIAKDFLVDFSETAYSVKFPIVSQARIIHEDEDCLVVYQPGRSAFTLISFASIGDRPSGLWFWGKAAFGRLGFDSIGIVSKSNHRYSRSVMAQLVPAISAHAQPIRIGYGFSMGAYGALRNGRLLGLTHVLALSPVNYALTSAGIRKIIWDPSFCPERNEGPLLGSHELAPVNLQILDPFFPLDWEQGELFASAGRIRTIRTPFTDHFSIGLMRNSETLKQTIGLLLDQDFNGINALLNKIRRAAPERAVNLARGSSARGNRARANRLWQRALEKGVKSEVIGRGQISGLVEYGRRRLASCSEVEIEGVEQFIEEIALEAPTALRLQRELAHWCMVYSAPKAALGPLRRAVGLAPGDMDGWLALGRALHVSGQTKEALRTLREARDNFDDHHKLNALISEYRLEPFLQIEKNFWKDLIERFRLETRKSKMASLFGTSKDFPLI